MTERCLTLGCPEAVRLAKEEPCTGVPDDGEENGAVISCIRNWSIEPIVREGEAAEFISDCGNMVIREKQDDQLLGYTVSFETSTRSNELEALVTGGELIESGGLNIGSYKSASNLACDTASEDPRFVIEAFYKLSRCVSGANHVRWVLPMAQFKVTELDREGTITFYRYTAETGIALANALAAGPYNDFPADVLAFLAARDADEYTAGFDFEENVSISGSCGTVEVPSPGVGFVEFGDDEEMLIGAMAQQDDGKIVAVAHMLSGLVQAMRINEDGSVDTTFDTDGIAVIDTVGTDGNVGIAVRSSDDAIYVSYLDDATDDVHVAKLSTAGALVGAFGTAGIVTIANSRVAQRSIFVRSDGDIVVGTELDPGGTNTGRWIRLNGTTGAVVDTQDYTPGLRILGSAQVSDSVYVAYLDDLATADFYIATADLVGNSVNEQVVVTAIKGYDGNSLQPMVGVNRDSAGNIFVAGIDVGGTNEPRVAKITGLLALDGAFDTDGIVTFNPGPFNGINLANAIPLSTGQVHVSGSDHQDSGLAQEGVTALYTSAGALVATHGTAGISELAPGPDADVHIWDSIADEANGAVFHFGSTDDPVNGDQPFFYKTLIATGQLDTRFGS